jgi:hypothetical protein
VHDAEEGSAPPHVWYRSPSGETSPGLDITPAPWQLPEPVAAPDGRNGAGTAALALGCLALVCTGLLFFLFPLGLVFALVAVGLGLKGRRRARYGLATNPSSATAGLTLGLVALVLGGLLATATVWFVHRYDEGAVRDCIRDEAGVVDTGHCILDVVDHS